MKILWQHPRSQGPISSSREEPGNQLLWQGEGGRGGRGEGGKGGGSTRAGIWEITWFSGGNGEDISRHKQSIKGDFGKLTAS